MSLYRQFVSVFIWLSMVAICSTAAAQSGPMGHHHDSVDFDGLHDPFCEIDTDWFEPIDCYCPDERPPNSGWFFSYERTAMFVTRPREAPGPAVVESINFPGSFIPTDLTGGKANDLDADSTWGNRFDFGYVTEDGSGYTLIARKIYNPRSRLSDPNLSIEGDPLTLLDGEEIGETFLTLNGFNIYDVELNKTWRLAPTPQGGFLEPLYGIRYMRIRDHSDRRDLASERILPPAIGPPNTNNLLIGQNQDVILEQEITTDNDLFGGQFGMQYVVTRGRWVIATDVRGLMFYNYRDRERIRSTGGAVEDVIASYDANGIITASGTANTGSLSPTRTTLYDDSNNFVYGGEFHLNTTFEVTRSFGIRLGGEVIALSDGIGRGQFHTSESMVMAGLSFGLAFNR